MVSAFISSAEKPREACFDPGNIMNGTRIGADFKLGSTVTYQCDAGYKIVDPSSITCVIGADGKPSWDGVLPSCSGACGLGLLGIAIPPWHCPSDHGYDSPGLDSQVLSLGRLSRCWEGCYSAPHCLTRWLPFRDVLNLISIKVNILYKIFWG